MVFIPGHVVFISSIFTMILIVPIPASNAQLAIYKYTKQVSNELFNENISSST